jgi:heparan-alpha-glucosaminide N-acetyltransferase
MPATAVTGPAANRVPSLDAVRGLVMAAMIYVNDVAGAAGDVVPAWMKHFPDDGNGLTFVDVVFPAFLFVAGLSIPVALGPRLGRAGAGPNVLLHVATRTLSLLALGVLMVKERPDADAMGWSPSLWLVLMYLSAILAFGSMPPWPQITIATRAVGAAGLVALAFVFRGPGGQRIVTLRPFGIHHDWWGILGLIGWAYLVGSVGYILFRGRPTATFGCVALLYCLYPADQTGLFAGLWIKNHVEIGEVLGSQAAITASGILLASVLTEPVLRRVRFTVLFVAGCAAAAWLLDGLYGINKYKATPSWCLWASAATAVVWLAFDLLAAVRGLSLAVRPFAIAGQNVLLAYLLHNLLYPVLDLLHLDGWYDSLARPDLAHAVGRAAGCAAAILALTAGLNRAGFRLKL